MAIVKAAGGHQVRLVRKVRPLAEVLEGRQLLATITVNSSGDADGADGGTTLSLRQAIEVSNGTLAVSSLSTTQQEQVSGALSSPNTIAFNIPGTGPFTIAPVSGPLPSVTSPAVLDGYTQPGASPNTNGPGLADNAVIMIAIDGASITNGPVPPNYNSGLVLMGGDTVRGLAVDNFYGASGGVSGYPPNIVGGGIVLAGGTNTVQGNFIGAGLTGLIPTDGNKGDGIIAIGSGGLIGGTDPADRNVIWGNGQVNIENRDGIGQLTIQGNFIGVNASGTRSVEGAGNFYGRAGVISALGDTIGGTVAGAGNVISGNLIGVEGQGLVEGNLIGTDLTGTLPVGNGTGIYTGIPISTLYLTIATAQPANMTIGGTAAGAANVISGNQVGVVVQNNQVVNIDTTPLPHPGEGLYVNTPSGLPQSVLIQGNRIGTDIPGTSAVGNGIGVQVVNFGAATIGGTASGAGNIISGNLADGISTDQSTSGNLIQGNLVGLDASAAKALGNGGDGIQLAGHSDTVGGTTQGAGNIIAGNGSAGLVISPQPSSFAAANFRDPLSASGGDLVQGNLVGLALAGGPSIPNAGPGLLIAGSANTIGGTAAGATNTIVANSGAGVAVVNYVDGSTTPPALVAGSGQGNAILANLIYGNGGPGIDLGNDGVTTNIPAGSATGPNKLQPYPVIINLVTGGFDKQTGTEVTLANALLVAAPSTAYTIEFFASPSRPDGFGDGQAYLGSQSVTTDASGRASFGFIIPPSAAGMALSMTATDPAGNTSEFTPQDATSANGLPTPLVAVAASPSTAPQGQPITLIAAVGSMPAGQPTGLVGFVVDGVVVGFAPLNAQGMATLTLPTSQIAVGAGHTVTAAYQGDAKFAPALSSTPASFAITAATSSTVLIAGSTMTATQGQPITFAAVVGAGATGLVAFVVNGSQVLGYAPLDASGNATFVTDQLNPGQISPSQIGITAVYLGDASRPPGTSVDFLVMVTAGQATKGPSVTRTAASGTKAVTVSFDQALLLGTAQDTANYAIAAPNGGTIAITSATYDPSNRTVTLTTQQALNPKQNYKLTVKGVRVGGVQDVFGLALNAKAPGRPGSNTVANFKG